ncbi:MAG: hypothetical protein FWE54_06775 [Methanimicrococcus sp.]|nr:hypothetical protein [Methanimicrococcus sp.]
MSDKVVNAPLAEMQITYIDDPAYSFSRIQLESDETIYSDDTLMLKGTIPPRRGKEVGYAIDDHGVNWRIFELKGYSREEYLLIFERDNMDVVRIMTTNLRPVFGVYILENVTREQKITRMMSVTLYQDGAAFLATPMISSFTPMGFPCYYSFENGELLIYYERENDDTIAFFDVVDENTLIFREAYVPLFADVGARYNRMKTE